MATPKYNVDAQNKEAKLEAGVDQHESKVRLQAKHEDGRDQQVVEAALQGDKDREVNAPNNPIPYPADKKD